MTENESREQKAGNRKQGTESREQEAENRPQEAMHADRRKICSDFGRAAYEKRRERYGTGGKIRSVGVHHPQRLKYTG